MNLQSALSWLDLRNDAISEMAKPGGKHDSPSSSSVSHNQNICSISSTWLSFTYLKLLSSFAQNMFALAEKATPRPLSDHLYLLESKQLADLLPIAILSVSGAIMDIV